MNKTEWLLLLDVLELIAERTPHGGSEVASEKFLTDKLKDLRRRVERWYR
jgi:hypothetical protein